MAGPAARTSDSQGRKCRRNGAIGGVPERHAGCSTTVMLRDTCPELASSDELWKVRLPSGDRTMTLDELDAAFEAGHLDTDTLVCAPGSSEFQRLGAAAGLDPEPAEPAIVPRPMNSMSPMVLSQEPPSYARMPMPSLDLGEAPFQKKFSKKLLAIPAGLAVLAAIIGIAASASASSATLAAAGEAAKTEMVAPTAPSPAVTAPPATTETPAAAAAPSLTDGQKKLLAMKDKKVEAAAKAKRALTAPPAKHMSMSKGKSSAPFTKGGNPHDPLNGAI